MRLKKQKEIILRNRSWFFLLFVVAASFLFFYHLTIKLADFNMRRELLQKAQIVAEAISIEGVKNLTGTEADLETADFIRLKKQLSSIHTKINECRYIYILGQNKEEKVFFYIDVGNGGNEAIPGDIYDDIPKGYLTVFETAFESTQGPYTDKWGTFISASIPLFDLQSEVPIAVLGIDIDAGAWRRGVLSRAIWLVIGLLFVFILLLGLLIKLFVSLRKQRHTSQILQDEKNRYKSIIEGTNVGTWEWNVQTGETIFNEMFVQMAGYALDDLAPISIKTWEWLAHPDDLKVSNELLEKHFKGETDFYESECRIKHKEGHWIWVLDRGKVITRTKDFKPLWVYGTHTDITERKLAEVILNEKEKRDALQRAAISELVLDQVFAEIDLTASIQRVVEILSASLGVARSSIWSLSSDETELKCISLFDTSENSHSTGAVLIATQFPNYFNAFKIESRINVEDAQNDPRTNEMTETYLTKMGITSMLDAGIFIEGRLVGVICCEHIGTMRKWHDDEGAFVSTVSAIVAQLFVNEKRKRAEAKLQASESRYRSVIAVSNTGVWEFNSKSKYFWCSSEYFEMLGRKPKERFMDGTSNLNENWLDLIHPDDRQRAAEHFENYLETGSVGMYENFFRMSHVDGSWVWIWSRGQTLLNPDGSLSDLTVGTQINITERKLAEEQIIRARELAEESERKTQQLYYELQTSEEEIRATSQELAATNDALSQSFEELEQAKEKALESEEMYRSLLETVPDIIIKTDVEGNTIFANEQAFKLIGNIPKEEVYGRNIMSFIAKEDLHRAYENMQLMLQQSLGMQEYRINIDGENYFDAEINGEVIRDKNGSPVGMVFTIRDVTQRKLAEEKILAAKERAEENEEAMQKLYYELQTSEEEIRATNEELYATTDALKENIELLLEANKKAEESNRLKTAFLQNISHEVRTPLNAICGFSQFLSNSNLTVESRKAYIDIILNSSNQLLTIVSDIITISSIETGQEKLTIANVNINSLFDELQAIFNAQVQAKSISLKNVKYFTKNEDEVLTDRVKLTQILNNLLANALKFTTKGEIEFGYSLQANELEFYVKDSGIGIDKSNHEMIFDRFIQAEDNTHVQYGGTGLGLSICKGFVELLGGRIWVESEIDQGATFLFTIPFEPVNVSKVKDLTHKQIERPFTTPTILIAEDQEFNFMYLKAVLSSYNCKVIHAKNGQEAVDFCRENPEISLVLMDIKMPVLDGYNATKKIREIRSDITIVAQTAYATAQEEEKYKDVFDSYITKPIDSAKITELLTKYIE